MNQAEHALKSLLGPLMREQGFKPQSSYLGFRRRTSFGFHQLSALSFAMGKGGPYVVDFGLGVRHNQIEDVVNQLGHIWGEANQKNTTSVYRSLEFFPFDGDRDGRKVLASERLDIDANRVGEEVAAMLSADGNAFFRRYSDVYECSVGLNAPIETRAHPLCNNFPSRAYYGVTAAALSQPERVPSLLESYAEYARQSGSVDNGVYEVGKGLSGIDAIVARLEFVAETALSVAQ